MALHIVAIPQAGDQSDFSISKQISPVRESTFGWKTRVLNMTLGGVSGYSGVSSNSSLN